VTYRLQKPPDITCRRVRSLSKTGKASARTTMRPDHPVTEGHSRFLTADSDISSTMTSDGLDRTDSNISSPMTLSGNEKEPACQEVKKEKLMAWYLCYCLLIEVCLFLTVSSLYGTYIPPRPCSTNIPGRASLRPMIDYKEPDIRHCYQRKLLCMSQGSCGSSCCDQTDVCILQRAA
jgi:hypothetical protein